MKKYILMMILALGLYAETTDSVFVEDSFIEEIVEDDFFSNSFETGSIEELTADFNKESISFTGDFKTSGSFSDYEGKASTMNAEIESNVNIDVRLKEGVKAYTSLNLSKTNDDTKNPEFLKLNEMFFDFNVNDKIYVRSGKQNLAWGRGYFFNPTDLINIEKKALDDVGGQREGNFGVKVHVPYGLEKNFYAYLQMEDKTLLSEGSLALKYEFLIKNSEFSLATIIRNPDNYKPVLAFDFASSIGDYQTFGEFIVQDGKNLNLNKDIVLQGTLGYSRTFDREPKEEEKTLTLIQEAYYNGAGYNDREDALFYNPYADGKYYLATFITANKFYHKDLSAGINALSNLNENVHQLGGNLTYKLNDEVSLGGNLTTFLGEQGALKGTIPRYTLGLSANINF